ncbi:MAG: Mrp/NBP35 family ATP-binding protein [Acetobacter sp.]|nr:Mrp/NBP35 family ATP-binding protein [Bacteroides sp.]MCM1340333.1 Mrp/NBP35 family ATP-binding protein [Acetobacter sp.]MCM1433020.1 Mrp/NBP35 family ATP-binding protein [Clostridiales bacterium]
MSECNHDCSSCKSNCGERKPSREDFLKPMNKYSNIKKVIGIVSGKGGVGKSLVSCLLASKCAKAGLKVGILDADITGPSVPKSFGINSRAMQDEECLLPTVTDNGVKVMSINLLLEDVNSPVVWRGPVISGVIEQFWSDVRWGELDYLFVDMPPGTGDVALTVFQSLPVDGIVIVSTPQDLVKMIVNKAFNMAKLMNVSVLGLVENMSYYTCPKCNEKINIFGESKIDETAAELGVPVLAKLPINPEINKMVDEGRISEVECSELDDFIDALKG